ncbi:MAG: translation initiation factor IF-2 [Planctomycetota bacterium]
MAYRIYALAKDLNIDSKELVDACDRAGIPGKGSALASLTEDEVVKVKAILNGGGGAGPAPASSSKAAPAPAPERPSDAARSKDRMKVIVAPKAATPSRARKKVEEPSDEAAAEAAEAAPTEAASAEAATADKPERPDLSRPGPLASRVRKEDYIGPGGAAGKMPVIGGGKGDAGKPKRAGDAPKAKPVVRLGAMPTAKPKKEKPKEKDDAAAVQKPDMKLPTEVLGASGGKVGSKPLASHLKRAERTLEAEKLRARGKSGGDYEEEDKKKTTKSGRPLLGGREQRQAARGARTGGRRPARPMMRSRRRRSGVNTAAPRKDRVEVQLPCTVRELSEAGGIPAMQILGILKDEGLPLTALNINATLDPDLAELIAEDLQLNVDFLQPETLEDKVLARLDDEADPEDDLVERAPVITFLGHVDHGKTSLLDRLIGIDVAAKESGGITQHIRAYQIDKDGRPISLVDTPGHEAFTAMRARGAGVTDIVVLVVAADDGVMPQTEEAISHAKAAEAPIVVALNKIDLPGADVNKAMQDLAANELLPVEWGGDVEVVKTSATTGEGLDDLLETVLTVAELHEYKSNPNRSAIGVCLEAQQDADQGVLSKFIVQRGTLRVGDIVVCGDAYGKVRAMVDPLNPMELIDEAGPSRPVDLLGLDTAPPAGQKFYVLDDVSQARDIAEDRADQTRAEDLALAGPAHVTLDNLFERLEGAAEVQTLNLIIRADVRGSIEAIKKEMAKLEHPEVKLRILQASVGGVSEADVQLANASDAIVIAFNVVPDDRARSLADQYGVEVRRYSVIYKITEELQAAMEGMLRPEEREVELGRALVQAIFKISRVGVVAGCRVLQGVVERNSRVRVIRDSTIVGDYPLDTLRREKDDVKEVREGYECGIKLAGFNDVKEADLLEAYKIEKIARTFDD